MLFVYNRVLPAISKFPFYLILFLIAGNVKGQEDTTTTISLEELTIHGYRINTLFRESSRNISVITKKEIQHLPAQSLPELLLYVPGIDIRQRGPVGVQADIGIRGGTFEQSLVLINGIKLSDPQTGHHSLNVPVNLKNVHQVEILKGPGARIYGQNAFSGAVNFITRVPDRRYAGLRIFGGEHGLFGGLAEVSLPGAYGQYISISRDVSDGYRHNTDFTIDNLFYQSEWDIMGGKMEFIGGLTNRQFGANGFYASPDYTEQYEEVRTSLMSLGFKKKVGTLTIHPRIYWRRNRDNYFFVRNQPEIYRNLHYTNVGALETNIAWENPVGKTGIGLEFRNESINGEWVRNGEQSRSNLDGYSRKNFGMFMEHRLTVGKFDLTPGLYINYYSDFDWNAFPGIDIGYSLSDEIRIYGNAGISYRIPTFYDQYYQSPVERGNPDLDPEKSAFYEVGSRYLNGFMNVEMNLFHQDARKLIDWVETPVNDSTTIWQASNFSNIDRNGIEIASKFYMDKIFYDSPWIKNLFLSYNFINSDLQNEDRVSRYVLENLRHQIISGLDHRVVWDIYHNFRIRYNEREQENEYWLFDSKIYWNSQQGHIVFVEVTNLFDTQYTEVLTPMPGRWFRAGLEYNFEF